MNPHHHGRSTPECPAFSDRTPLYGAALARDPSHLYEESRRRYGAVAPVEIAPGIGAWLVLGHQEVLELIWDERAFSSDARHWNALGRAVLPAEPPLLPLLGPRPALLRLDGQEHRRQRQAVTQALNLIDTRRLRTLVRLRADALVDGWAARGAADLIGDYARPLTWGVFTQLVGLPEEAGGQLATLVGDLVDGSDEATREATRSEAELLSLLRQLTTGKRATPGPDLPSWLLAHPARLSDDEITHNLLAVLLTGPESTISWIGNTVRQLLRDAGLGAALAAGRVTVGELADRALWSDAPVPNIAGRWARADTAFAGRSVRAGDLLIPCLAAANTDPALQSAAASGSRAHLAWGTGAHGCPAKDVARTLVETAVDAMLRRQPEVHLGVPENALPWRPSLWCGAPARLPVVFPAFPPAAPTASAAPATYAAVTVMPVPDRSPGDRAVAGMPPQRWGWWNSMAGW
ncbi:cytochrome P450 family protein [Streptomyces apocyni]|uniref:cytochrome P450 n=1 Tax=Streptomyces apocyni TaxID=2654677 RepID=UPI0012E9E466|nr:cytochrome P450 [Streptomyces apocyni]